MVETTAAAIGSALPWPSGWAASAGGAGTTSPRQTMTELNRSARDSTASATSALEWPMTPAASFAVASKTFAIIPRKVARRLRWRRFLGTAQVLSNRDRTEEQNWAGESRATNRLLTRRCEHVSEALLGRGGRALPARYVFSASLLRYRVVANSATGSFQCSPPSVDLLTRTAGLKTSGWPTTQLT